jgi:hypothetical protein
MMLHELRRRLWGSFMFEQLLRLAVVESAAGRNYYRCTARGALLEALPVEHCDAGHNYGRWIRWRAL